MLVEGGKIRWDSTVVEIFPEPVAAMDSNVKAVTLEQLLSHTSGIPSDNDVHMKLLQQSFAQEHKNLDEVRYWVIGELVRQPLQSKPGTKFAYANMGYILAGAMLERVSGKTWEELIVERVFNPLGLKSAGLGPQSTLGRVDAPLGHVPLPDGTVKSMLAGPYGDHAAAAARFRDRHDDQCRRQEGRSGDDRARRGALPALLPSALNAPAASRA